MAGHSHSANIAVRKGKQDVARAKLFSKLARYIMIAARNGGGDPTTNLRLRYAIDKARGVSMPKDKIERAVLKGSGELESDNLEDVIYEGYGQGNTAIIVEATTDNRARTSGDVRICFEKNGGTLGTPGSVGYLFDHKGLIVIDAKKYPNEDEVMTVALDAEAEDFKKVNDVYEILCETGKFMAVQDTIAKAGYEWIDADIKYLPKSLNELEVEKGRKLMKILDALENNEDVQNVYHSAVITPEMLE